MWKLNKPSIKQATGKDVDELIKHCVGLDDSDRSALISLYKNYDAQMGSVNDAQLKIIAKSKANVIESQYSKTYNGEKLNYIRTELNKEIDLCPYCSMNSVSNLDHFMPKSKFKALSVCRLNLIPSCSFCNRKKGDDDSEKYIHAYYEILPNVVFLLADVKVVKSRLSVKFHFDSKAINDVDLESKLKHQVTQIELWKRLSKSSNNFINDLFAGCYATTSKDLNDWLRSRLIDHEIRYELNDWRTAILRGMLACKQLDINVINSYRRSPHKINGGAGA